LAESGPKKGRHWKNSEGQFCPSFLKTPDKLFFSDMEKHAKLHLKLSFYKWFLRNRKKKTYQAFFGKKDIEFLIIFLEFSPQSDFWLASPGSQV
jgi:hypothetical protein